ncbi:IS256 family transposase, partial [Alicyclobacillus suci]|uniref:IS256 family transposase n=1 Tax=Alicyclobacillus suci TaxID=2816080 RepID=UPI001A8D6CA0
MSLLSREQLRQFIKENDFKSPEDIQAALKEVFASTMQEMLEAELETHLGYAKHAVKDKMTDNSRNGHSHKSITSEYGEVDISVPRDRKGEFDPLIIKKHQTNTVGIEDQVIALYARGMSTRDIQAHLEHLYGVDVSPTLVSNITDKLLPMIKEWQNRPLNPVYAVVFMDAIHYKVKQDGQVVSKASYMIVGIDLDGRKDVLGMWIG